MEMPNTNLQYSQEDIEKNRTMAILAYILFFLPMLAAPQSKFAMYHANQGLVLFLIAMAVNLVGSLISFVGWFIIIPLGNLAIIILAVLGIINAYNGEAKPLPLIGGINLIKRV